ncbi:hypothetical protein chiPu_0011530 [Chiloscyllium punctatum]|uniref:Uncharacterized protein n=1 Tax=Chiloscyllium punctatum TaxID=137246 RepID=A0A401SRT8_CHIPU|nr:hypothetical protein [Chiloscyllium punctatum]
MGDVVHYLQFIPLWKEMKDYNTESAPRLALAHRGRCSPFPKFISLWKAWADYSTQRAERGSARMRL